MILTLKNTFTDEEITVDNVTAFYALDLDYEVRVYTELNGSRDMTTYRCWYVVGARIR